MMLTGRVNIYKTGDICPFCGGRIQTEDPFLLGVITGLAYMMEPARAPETETEAADADRT